MTASLYWHMAVHDPPRLHKAVLENSLPVQELATATEMLGLLADKQEAQKLIQRQLLHDNERVVLMAIFALRVVFAADAGFCFSEDISQTLKGLRDHPSEEVKKEALACLEDFTFVTKTLPEKTLETEYKEETMTTEFDIRAFFGKVDVLDKGSVELIDGMVCDPKLKIVNSARVSHAKTCFELTEKDIKLIEFMKEHEHTSPFRHSFFSFRVKAPLFVFRQWWKYQISSEWIENENVGSIQIPETNWNEMSGRYVEFQPEFFVPDNIRIQSKINKQGSDGKLEALPNGENPVEFFEKSCLRQYEDYKYLVAAGAAKEQVRSLLPQNIYTECIWTCSLQCLMYFLHQRLKTDAQFEIRSYALAVKSLVLPMFEPLDLVK